MKRNPNILAIETSCDDTAVAIVRDQQIVANIVVTQKVHADYGGVVPEVASRAHLVHIIPGIDQALKISGVRQSDLSAIAVTAGPGLIGSLIVGLCTARSLAAAWHIPIIGVDHLHAHVLSCFIDHPNIELPMLCLTVSGGHTQLVLVDDVDQMKIIGRTQDDAAGEAFDKIGKMIGLPYPAGPQMDRLAQDGHDTFSFTRTDLNTYDFSFSGLKTHVMYFLKERVKQNPRFIDAHLHDIAASAQSAIVDMLLSPMKRAIDHLQVRTIGIAGGVSANSALRSATTDLANLHGLSIVMPKMAYCTDNAAMIAMAGWVKYRSGKFDDLRLTPYARHLL